MHDKQLREEIVKRKLETGRSAQSLSEEYGIPTATITKWVKAYRKAAAADEDKARSLRAMEENAKLRKELEELKKETVRKYMNVDLSLKSITRKKSLISMIGM